MNELEKNYLAHHGILGQKWHKRNGPPYPLDAGDHSKSEKEAGYKKSLDGGHNEELYDRKGRLKQNKTERLLNKHDLGRAKDIATSKDFDKKASKYSDKIKSRQAKGKNIDKLEERKKAYKTQSKIFREYADEHSKIVNDMISQIEKDGEFKVRSSVTARQVNAGETFVKSTLISGLFSPIAGTLYSAKAMRFEEGTKYRVKQRINSKYQNPDGSLNKRGEKELRKVEEDLDKTNELIQKRYDNFKKNKLNTGVLVIDAESRYDRIKEKAIDKLGDNIKKEKKDPLTIEDCLTIARRSGVNKSQIEEWEKKLNKAAMKEQINERTKAFVREAARQNVMAEQQRHIQMQQQMMQQQMQQQMMQQIQQQIINDMITQQMIIQQSTMHMM